MKRPLRGKLVTWSVVGAALGLVFGSGLDAAAATGPARLAWPAGVFAVGTFSGLPGNVTTTESVASIQLAVNEAQQWAAKHTPAGGVAPDTYVLLAPGDYKTDPNAIEPAPPDQDPGAVLITGANVWLVGMNRNSVIVDGTASGPPCSTASTDQVFGPNSSPQEGLNGIMVYKAPGSWVENLTTCNFLDGTGGDGGAGNEIWWNGGADGGTLFVDTQGPHIGSSHGGFIGKYLTATTTYYDSSGSNPEATAATYGIFSSDWDGGIWNQTYASNFNDSGYYIGACQDACNQEVNHAWAEYNALGYSGSNSGGWMLIEHSRFDNNEDGFDTNSQNGDNPPPQNGSCSTGVSPPVKGATTCWVFYDNLSDHNNDPNVPTYGSAAAGPVGTGMSISGGRDDTIMDNHFEDNDAWGNILVPYPDSGGPCTGGTAVLPSSPSNPGSDEVCWYDESGDAVIGNTYVGNGGYGNPSNGDIAATNLEPGATDCFSGNTDSAGLTTSPPEAETLYPTCTGSTVAPDANAPFTDEVACDSGSISLVGPVTGSTLCPPGANYPRQTQVVLHALPGAHAGTYGGQAVPAMENPESTGLPTMPNPCAGVPTNPWCPSH